MKAFPALTIFGLVLLAAIFAVGFIGEASRGQLFGTFTLVAGIAVVCALAQRCSSAEEPVTGHDCIRQSM